MSQRQRGLLFVTTLIVLSLTQAGAAQEGGDDAEAKLIEEIYAASPGNTVGVSHFPVPMIYADWETEVVRRFGRGALARSNESLYQDLPPVKAEKQPVPGNAVLVKLFAEDESRAAKVLVAALGADPGRPQWSLIAACAKVPGDAPVDALLRIAGKDPSPTDRAFALKELGRRGGESAKAALLTGILDDNQSVRRIAAHGLAESGDEMGDMIILSPVSPRNPFHLLLLAEALERVLPGTDVRKFVGLDWHERHGMVRKARPALCERFRGWKLRG